MHIESILCKYIYIYIHTFIYLFFYFFIFQRKKTTIEILEDLDAVKYLYVFF